MRIDALLIRARRAAAVAVGARSTRFDQQRDDGSESVTLPP
jgi:hypothetical protein